MNFTKKRILCISAITSGLLFFILQLNNDLASFKRQLLITKIRVQRLFSSDSSEAKVSTSNCQKPELIAMRNWSIRNKYITDPDPLLEPHREKLSNSELEAEAPNLLSLRRPGTDNIISTFKIGPGNVELNPRDSYQGIAADYGPIPCIDKLSKTEADLLWGDGQNSDPKLNEKSYQLVSCDFNHPDKEAILDITFQDSHIKKYRLRMSDYESPWRTVRGGWSDQTILPLLVLLTVVFLLKVRF